MTETEEVPTILNPTKHKQGGDTKLQLSQHAPWANMWGIVAQKEEREGGKKERKGEKEQKRVELVISMRVPSFFEILRTLA
jgi:hypothetical protein